MPAPFPSVILAAALAAAALAGCQQDALQPALIATAPAAADLAADPATRAGSKSDFRLDPRLRADAPPPSLPLPAKQDVPAAPPTVNDVACVLRVSRADGARVLTAVAMAHGIFVDGTFWLEAIKTGDGGTATFRQSGHFRLAPGGEAVLGEVAGHANDRISARLRLNWQGGGASCRTGA